MALVRTFQRGRGRIIHLVSIPGYHRAEGGDAIFQLLSSPPRPAHPPVVLMESFDCGDSATAIVPGGAIPYGDGDVLAAAGVERGRALVEDPTFRRAWSAEAVAVWSALRVGSEVSLRVSRRYTVPVTCCCIAVRAVRRRSSLYRHQRTYTACRSRYYSGSSTKFYRLPFLPDTVRGPAHL